MSLINEPKTKKGLNTLSQICQVAEELFSQKGYFETGVSEIALKSGIAQGTIYRYFPDKKTIFRYLLVELSSKLRESLHEKTDKCNTRQEAEEQGSLAFLEFVHLHPGLFKIVWQAQFVDMEAFRDYYDDFSKSYINAISSAQKAGEMKEMDPEVLSYCLIGINNFIALKYVVFDEKEDYEPVVREVMKLLTRGVFPEK